jgi:hypothetical protein
MDRFGIGQAPSAFRGSIVLLGTKMAAWSDRLFALTADDKMLQVLVTGSRGRRDQVFCKGSLGKGSVGKGSVGLGVQNAERSFYGDQGHAISNQ